jgi:hypothetical protein
MAHIRTAVVLTALCLYNIPTIIHRRSDTQLQTLRENVQEIQALSKHVTPLLSVS